MNADNFRDFAKASIDFVIDYTENIRDREVLPAVEPGYLHRLVPDEMPEAAEDWRTIIADMDRVIMPGVTHWQSPNFHAYYPTATSYPSIVGELLSAGIGVIGFSWITSPACTELEVVVMNWLGKLIGIPDKFLNSSEGLGGGVIQGSASEATLLCLLAAKERKWRGTKEFTETDCKSKMVAYTSDQANSSVEKAGLLASTPMRLLTSDGEGRLTGKILRDAFEKDIARGLIPTYVCATFGTTPTCAFDCIDELVPVCQEYGAWLHVDAAYAGAALICPENRHLIKGWENVDSFNFNPHKWLLVNFDCSALWVQNAEWLVEAFNVDRIYLQHKKDDDDCWAPDYRHWQIPLGRRFRALKLWITLRCYGKQGLQAHIRNHINLAKEFEHLVKSDNRFEIVSKASMGLVCFRLKGSCEHSKKLLELVTARRRIFIVAGKFQGKLCIRFAVCSRQSRLNDIYFAWNEIVSQAEIVLNDAYQKLNERFGVLDICEESARSWSIQKRCR